MATCLCWCFDQNLSHYLRQKVFIIKSKSIPRRKVLFRYCTHYAREMSVKRSFISTVRHTVHTNLSRNGAFPKHISNWRNFKTPVLFVFVCT